MEIKEVWKSIKGYEGKYEISNIGNIKSLDRIIIRKNGRKHTVKGCLKKQFFNKKGYHIVNLSNNGIHTTLTVHQLVAVTFLNHKRCGMERVVNHINNIKTDNRVNNLEIVSNRYNLSCHRTKGSSKYTGVHFCKTSKRWVSKIQYKKKAKCLGYFKDEIKAHLAYQNFLKNENILDLQFSSETINK